MSRKNHAAAEAGEHEERIEVNLDAKDGEQITRRPARGSVVKPRNDRNDDIREWEQKSRKVQKRLVQQARSFNQQIADIQAENQRQLALRDDRIAKLERGGDNTTADDVAHAKVMDGFEEAIAAAQEEGDSRKVAKLTREMTQADNKFWAAKTAKATGGTGGKGNEDAGKGAGAGGGVQQPKSLVPTKAGVAWAKANAEWFDDPTDRTHVAARAMANALYKEKADDGDDRDDPEFYEEIRREVAKRYPEIETVSTVKGGRIGDPDDDDDEDEDDDDVSTEERDDDARDRRRETKPARRAASLSLPNRGDPKHNRANRLATITSAEQRTMRAVGLDPDKNKDVMAFLNSRNEMDASA